MPSTVLGEDDSIAAWMLDNAVTWFGITIENALSERVEIKLGGKTEFKPRYSLARLLHPGFKLPEPAREPEEVQQNPWAELMSWVGRSKMVRKFQYVGPKKTDGEEEA